MHYRTNNSITFSNPDQTKRGFYPIVIVVSFLFVINTTCSALSDSTPITPASTQASLIRHSCVVRLRTRRPAASLSPRPSRTMQLFIPTYQHNLTPIALSISNEMPYLKDQVTLEEMPLKISKFMKCILKQIVLVPLIILHYYYYYSV